MEFCLTSDNRVLIGPIKYNKAQFAAALAYHGIPADLLPDSAPAEPLQLHHLRLLPVTDLTDQAEPAAWYHIGQPVLTVTDTAVERRCPVTPYPISHIASLVLVDISEVQDSALAVLEIGYTEREVKSWHQQQTEAAAWSLDNSTPVPLLENLAAGRGVTVAVVAAKIQAKVQQASARTGLILGAAQGAGDKIAALKALDAAGKLPDDWFDQLQSISKNWRKNWPPELLKAST